MNQINTFDENESWNYNVNHHGNRNGTAKSSDISSLFLHDVSDHLPYFSYSCFGSIGTPNICFKLEYRVDTGCGDELGLGYFCITPLF